MNGQADGETEEILDLSNREVMRHLGHRIQDDALDYVENLRGDLVWQHAPRQVKTHFNRLLPLEANPAEEIYQEYHTSVIPHLIN